MRVAAIVLFLASFGHVLNLQAEQASERDLQDLRAHIEELEVRVKDLERRLSQPDKTKGLAVSALSGELQRWRQIHKGLSREDVRAILGEPIRIETVGFEHWYYSTRGSSGPHVSFYVNKVNGWKEP
jgi:hypothetical protein